MVMSCWTRKALPYTLSARLVGLDDRGAQGLRRHRAGVGRDAPERRAARSISAARLPSLAACTAARRPAGPEPIAIRSKWVEGSSRAEPLDRLAALPG